MSPDFPSLPEHVSPDGREIWEWAGKLSDHAHRLDRMRRLSADIAVIGTRCGDCDKWMKSSLCPAERNVNGRNHGPSMNGRKCGQFVETRAATERRTELSMQLVAEQSP